MSSYVSLPLGIPAFASAVAVDVEKENNDVTRKIAFDGRRKKKENKKSF